MKKIFKISLVLLALLLIHTVVFATDINTDNPDGTQAETQDQTVYGNENPEEEENEEEQNTNTVGNTVQPMSNTERTPVTSNSSTTAPVNVGSTAALSSSNLPLMTIINIILIVIGLLLILFAIAILIRLR